MGNNSSLENRGRPKTQHASDIIREGRSPNEKRLSSLEASQSSEVSADPMGLDVLNFSNNFSLRIRDSGLIGGKQIGEKSKLPTGPAIFKDDDNDELSHLPRGFPDAPSSEDLDTYLDTVKLVTSIWPEYSNICDIDIRPLKYPVRQTLQQILKRLSEQHDLIRNLSSRQHILKQQLADLKEERKVDLHNLARKDRDIRSLKEDVFILRKELKKYSEEGNSQALTSTLEANDVQESNECNNRVPPVGLQGDVSALKDKLRRAENALEEEKKKNEILEERLNSITSTTSLHSPVAKLRLDKTVTFEEYVQRFRNLEQVALDKVAKCLSRQLSHTPDKRRRKFSCAVVQKAYDVALNRVRQFKDLMKALISNPANPDVYREVTSYRPRGALAGQISLFENFKPGYEINDMSILAKKTKTAQDLPEALMEEVYNFLECMADYTNITGLVEGVLDSLRQEFGDCTTATLLNKMEFSDFLYDCCRFAWQICAVRQPLYVSSTEHWRYDERYHVTDGDNIPTNAEIDYYVFPILFRKEKSVDVLHRGRICIKT